ncbi:MAG: hypothetical protein E7308_05345 [Butyrivibrio sp.]|jgi:hypothetical protein|nr:hypothetical protein [Butyrivibrio sp.]MBE5823478.1 hypothetical protein [Butyrivibrio sp.]MBR1643041.1 hypothetical protein [Butyrivibrio sp.]
MGIDKDLNGALNDDALENVAGGMGDVQNLVYSDRTTKRVAATVQKGKAPKAGSLVYKETKSGNKEVDGKTFSGDVIGKGTMC